jgi:hypothetical protein
MIYISIEVRKVNIEHRFFFIFILDKSIKNSKEIEQANKLFVFIYNLSEKENVEIGHAQMIKIFYC